jgi:hypothetical protein
MGFVVKQTDSATFNAQHQTTRPDPYRWGTALTTTTPANSATTSSIASTSTPAQSVGVDTHLSNAAPTHLKHTTKETQLHEPAQGIHQEPKQQQQGHKPRQEHPNAHTLPTNNQPTSKIITTPIDPDRLQFHLDNIGYDTSKTKFLVDGFRYGFRLQHQGEVTNTNPENDITISEHYAVAKHKIESEVSAGRMKGPFTKQPFETFHISPLKLREKTTAGKFRLIHNLSWPYDETSINDNIPEHAKTVTYSNIQQAIKLIMTYPKGSVTRKTDIKDAFKIIPVHPDDYHKLGLKLGGNYYYDVTLPQGGSSSCQIFEAFSTALEAINVYYTNQLTTHYLDDFFFVDENAQNSYRNKRAFDTICDDIGVPQAPDKITKPSYITEFLGINLDSLGWKATLPQHKLQQYKQDIELALSRKKLTQKELQSLVGKLSFAAIVVPARSFLRRLIDKIHTSKSTFPVWLTNSMKQDLKVWLNFLSKYNGVTYFRALKILPSGHFNMGADASKAGYGAVFGRCWLQEKFPQSWQRMFDSNDIGITILELFPIYVLIGTFGSKIKNSHVLFHSDNEGVVQVINKQSSPNPTIMNIIRRLVLLLMEYNIMLRSQHIPGSKNVLCDIISRFQVTEQLLTANRMKLTPEVIPPHLSSSNFKLR